MAVVLAGGAPVVPPVTALPDGPSRRAYLIGLLDSLCAALLVIYGVLDVLSGQILAAGIELAAVAPHRAVV